MNTSGAGGTSARKRHRVAPTTPAARPELHMEVAVDKHRLSVLIAQHREQHVAPWEPTTSPEAKVEVAALIGSIRLEWAKGWNLWGGK